MTPRILALLVLSSSIAFAQSQPEFEVASIRPSTEEANQVRAGLRITGSEIVIAYLTLRDYVAMAYRVKPNQIVGPEWLTQPRFDIAAKIPDGVAPARIPEMMQALLASRFQMKTHHEMKEFNVYALTVAKSGLRIKEAEALPPPPSDKPQPFTVAATGSGAGVAVDLGDGSSFSLGNNKLELKRMTMTAMAETLTRFVDRPVLDMTNVTGRYDVTLDVTPEDYTALMIRSAINAGVVLPPQALRLLDNAPGDPLSPALQKSGLALEPRKAPLDVIVVDASSKTPTEN